jgi:hypothetical protein
MPKERPPVTDAVALAAIRWHANRLENVAISKYLTRRESYVELLKVLSEAGREMRLINRAAGEMCRVDEDCDPGFHCNNGDCEPDPEQA